MLDCVERTFPWISQVCQGLSHENRPVDASVGTIHSECHEYRVQYALHDIPITDDTATRLESISDLTPGCSICICIVANVRDGPVELPISVPCDMGRE